jgi:DMSO reductase family type II enzyme heme b subunit
MPAWKHEFDRELLWKIILGEFSSANRWPLSLARVPGQRPHGDMPQPALALPGRRLPEKTWLEWPVPPKPRADEWNAAEFVTRGKYIYYARCMPCHGITGRGDGPAANTMWPRPRDFTTEGFEIETGQPKFKFRTTKYGWLPTDEDLYRTISRGLVGSAMEGWGDVLDPDEIWQVIAYLKTLSPAWNDPEHFALNPNDPVVVREYTETDGASPIIDFDALEPPPITDVLIAEGCGAFRRAGCWQCHGIETRGDGMALGQHYDDWGYRAWPQNLSNPFNFKAGHSIKEIYRNFTTGLNGTVMPTLPPTTLEPNDPKRGEHLLWALAAYVHSQVKPHEPSRESGAVWVTRLLGSAPLDPLDPRWDRLPGTIVPLSGQVIVPPRWPAPSVNEVEVKAATSGAEIAIWLRWDDRRPNVTHADVPQELEPVEESPLGPKTYAYPALKRKAPVVFDARDQIELQWPARMSADARPHLLYGDAENPVVVWRWLADRQGLTVTKETVAIGGSHAERLLCSSRIVPSEERPGAAVIEGELRGPLQQPDEQPGLQPADAIRSRAHWSNGAWTVVMTRPLSAARPDDVHFVEPGHHRRPPQHPISVALHVWDGLAGESGLRMAISSWCYLVFERPRPMWMHGLAVAAALATLAGEIALGVWYRRRSAAE